MLNSALILPHSTIYRDDLFAEIILEALYNGMIQ